MADDKRSVRDKVRQMRATPLSNAKTPSELQLNRQKQIQLDALKPPQNQNKNFIDVCMDRQLKEGERLQARYYMNNTMWFWIEAFVNWFN